MAYVRVYLACLRAYTLLSRTPLFGPLVYRLHSWSIARVPLPSTSGRTSQQRNPVQGRSAACAAFRPLSPYRERACSPLRHAVHSTLTLIPPFGSCRQAVRALPAAASSPSASAPPESFSQIGGAGGSSASVAGHLSLGTDGVPSPAGPLPRVCPMRTLGAALQQGPAGSLGVTEKRLPDRNEDISVESRGRDCPAEVCRGLEGGNRLHWVLGFAAACVAGLAACTVAARVRQ